MPNSLDLKILENLSRKRFQENSDSIVQILLNNLTVYLELDPSQKNIRFMITKINKSTNSIFTIGVNRYTQGKNYVIEINEKYIKFLPFIVLREIYNLFVPREIRNYESVQLVINQIITVDLSKHNELNEWNALIKEQLEHYDAPSKGFDRLTSIDRLRNFFDLKGSEKISPTRFFFHYIRENETLITNRMEEAISDLHVIFFYEFEKLMWDSLINDDMIETVRCLNCIFNEKKHYKSFTQYQEYFQEFKTSNKLQTELSLRKFTKKMEWIKNESYFAPSYQVNWKSLNICLINIFLKFNPILNKPKIIKIIKILPFFLSPNISRNSFSLDIRGFIVIPKIYLDDLIRLVKNLEDSGYIIKHHLVLNNFLTALINLNYYREYSQNQIIVDPNHSIYDMKYEIAMSLNYGTEFHKTSLNLLDFLVLDRIRLYGVTGLGFERKSETLQTLKSDLLNEISTERAKIKDLRNTLEFFHKSQEIKQQFLVFLNSNKNSGFFFIKSILEQYLNLIDYVNKILDNNQEIKNFFQLKKILTNQRYSHSIETNILLINKYAMNIILKEIFSFLFLSRENCKKNIEKYKQFYALFNSCYNLRIFNLKSMEKILLDKDLLNSLYNIKEEKLRESFEKYKPYKITFQEIDKVLHKFLLHDPPIIHPSLLSSLLYRHACSNPYLILVNSPEVQKKLKQIEHIFILSIIYKSSNLITNEEFLCIEFRIPFLNYKERGQLFFILYNFFKEDIKQAKFYLGGGIYPAFSLKNFYDLRSKHFFYTKDLFEQFFIYAQKLLGGPLDPIKEKKHKQFNLWSKEKNLSNFIQKVNDHAMKAHSDLNISHLNTLLDFHLNIEKNLLDVGKFKETRQQFFFKNYIKSIKFIPAFQHFGFSQYYLYMYPIDIEEVDFKHLLHNSFQKVKFPLNIDNSNSFLSNFIWPYQNPNTARLNWLTKSKGVIREYCLFFVKNVIPILHFDYNLSAKGWMYNVDKFKIYFQNILFNKNYKSLPRKLKEFDLVSISSSKITPESSEYAALTKIYNWKSIDIKSYLGTRNYKMVNNIIKLLKKNLIFPYLSLKNLEILYVIYLIIPNLKSELNEIIIRIFSYFNYGFIYKIEGEYYIHGFSKEVKFQDGLMIKLYLPKCKLHEFEQSFDLIFEYLEIKDYLILNDLVNGKTLLKSIFGNLNFLNKYNPLKNLKWNDKDQIWMNNKLFTQKFEPVYPDLIYKEKNKV
jgi:hypothetical protein